MAVLGLKGKQVQCMFSLYHTDDGTSLTQLCELCDEDKGAMSRTVKELAEKQLVYVAEKDEHKYRNPIKLTPAGRTVAKIVTEQINQIFGTISAQITPAERNTLYQTLTQISGDLTQICANYNSDITPAKAKHNGMHVLPL